MTLNIEVDEKKLQELVYQFLKEQLGSVVFNLTPEDVDIEVKSKQNYRSEWEHAAFRARIQKAGL